MFSPTLVWDALWYEAIDASGFGNKAYLSPKSSKPSGMRLDALSRLLQRGQSPIRLSSVADRGCHAAACVAERAPNTLRSAGVTPVNARPSGVMR